jgi:hypothetical protein
MAGQSQGKAQRLYHRGELSSSIRKYTDVYIEGQIRVRAMGGELNGADGIGGFPARNFYYGEGGIVCWSQA